MTINAILIVNDHQEKLRKEAAQRRLLAPLATSSLRRRLASVSGLFRASFPGLDIAPGSVFPATH
jgi:hypothetical protein